MLRNLIFLLALIISVSCGQDKREQHKQAIADLKQTDTMAVLNDPNNNLNVQANGFSEIDSSGILMFPLAIGTSEKETGSMRYQSTPALYSWNIIFLNTRTNEYHLLSDRKMLIRHFNFTSNGSGNAGAVNTGKYIFYTVTTEDYNKDAKLTDEDPEYLFVTDKAGKGFRQVSPASYHLQNWQFIPSANKIVLTAKKDSDNNKKFDDKDETTTFAIDADTDATPGEVFPADFKNKLKILYDKDWKRQQQQ